MADKLDANQPLYVDATANERGATMDTLIALAARWKSLLLVPLTAGCVALGVSYLVAPTFTARTSFLPPQAQGSAAAAALSSLGALANLAGGGGIRAPADQYVSMLQSTTVLDRMIDRFDLQKVYDRDIRADTRRDLVDNTHIALSKRDGIIAIEVDDDSPKRAAEMANAYIDELRSLTSRLAITDAQQRRGFFERQLTQTRDRLVAAQVALQGSGFNQGALKAEPKAAAEAYARLKAEATTVEVRLQALRGTLADNAPEVVQHQATLAALRSQLARAEQASNGNGDGDYIGKYREFKYQETLFEQFARQYELARVDEAREGALIQVIDAAVAPEKKSRPKRARWALLAVAAAGLLWTAWTTLGDRWRRMAAVPQGAADIARLKQALRAR